MMVVTVLMMTMLIYQKEKAHTIKETMQDALTSSALGSISVDYLTFGVNGDIVFYNKDTDEAYNNLCNLLCKNLGLYRNGTFASSAETGTILLNTEKYPLCISKAILYERIDGKIVSTTYSSEKEVEKTNPIDDNTLRLSATPNSGYKKVIVDTNKEHVLTPGGSTVDTLGVYIEVIYPVNIAGKEKYIKTSVFVNLRQATI